jgi:hypothetical protein
MLLHELPSQAAVSSELPMRKHCTYYQQTRLGDEASDGRHHLSAVQVQQQANWIRTMTQGPVIAKDGCQIRIGERRERRVDTLRAAFPPAGLRASAAQVEGLVADLLLNFCWAQPHQRCSK